MVRQSTLDLIRSIFTGMAALGALAAFYYMTYRTVMDIWFNQMRGSDVIIASGFILILIMMFILCGAVSSRAWMQFLEGAYPDKKHYHLVPFHLVVLLFTLGWGWAGIQFGIIALILYPMLVGNPLLGMVCAVEKVLERWKER